MFKIQIALHLKLREIKSERGETKVNITIENGQRVLFLGS